MRIVLWAFAAVAASGLLLGCRADDEKPAPPEPAKAGAGEGAAAKVASSEATAGKAAPGKAKAAEEPLLLLDDGNLRLADGPPKPRLKRSPGCGPVADNARCHVCHLNYSDEELSVTHALGNVGCEKCHGSSDAHCGDEGNVTAPNIFYTKADIDPSCTVCHDPAKPVSGDLYCLHVRTPEEAGKLCTECHGAHRMAVRAVRWDPKTRKPYAVTARGK